MHFPFFDLTDVCKGPEQVEEKLKFIDFNEDSLKLDTNTIIIGNGPAGISLSAMLDGWHPFYNNSNPHPNPHIHQQFSSKENKSLLFQDLTSAATLLNLSEQNVSNSTPFGSLYDSLTRQPSIENNKINKSSILWKNISNNFVVKHIVLGNTTIGGSWTEFEDEIKAVSINNWMNLPGYSLADDFLGNPNLNDQRPTANIFKNYLIKYCKEMGILKNFRPNTKVLKIKKKFNGENYWEVNGINLINNENFILRCKNLVLACGKNKQRKLEFINNSKLIVYNLNSLKYCISNTKTQNHPVIVVGDGISAADSIICALERNCQVLHIIKRSDKQLKNIMLASLSPLVYPEYAQVFEIMTGQKIEAKYKRLTETTINNVFDNEIELNTPGGIIKEQFRCLSICIGRHTEFSLLEENKNLEQFQNYCSINDSSLFALGAMIGDNFVRYLVGGALCVAQTLILRNNLTTKTIRQPFQVLFNKNKRIEEESCFCCYKKKRRQNSKEKLKLFLRTNSATTTLINTKIVKKII
ncbi:hypothetical protein Mgra_00001289 [Meloidogyne graminicola]|uniref:L-ornithine N(5)-oxygenase n=1 Tax=Meloidogyne graminicola TaxID=189291 RepID=A0A8T0A1Q9_9BILA|nr:hypothetical protein Mgra_00001289 [Meloidogyne graminicola]